MGDPPIKALVESGAGVYSLWLITCGGLSDQAGLWMITDRLYLGEV